MGAARVGAVQVYALVKSQGAARVGGVQVYALVQSQGAAQVGAVQVYALVSGIIPPSTGFEGWGVPL